MGLGGLIVLALLAVLVAPFFIDWTAYRADFEREASRILGRPVVVRGPAEASILPFPSVTFSDVAVLGEDGAPLLSVDGFRMDAELAPYLSGEILIYRMVLDAPDLRVPIATGGAIEWPARAPQLPAGARVVLERVEVKGGTVRLENGPAGRTETLRDVEAVFSAESLAGPIAGSGTLDRNGMPVRFAINAGTAQQDGRLPLKLVVESEGLDASLTADGAARIVDGLPRLDGSLTLQRPMRKPAPSGQAGRPADMASTTPPLRLAAALALTPVAAELRDLRLAAGAGPQPYILTGAGALDYGAAPRFSLTLEGEQVDVDAIAQRQAEAAGQAGAAAPSFAGRVAALRALLAEVPRPALSGTVALSLPVVTAAGTVIRDVSFEASPTQTGWTVRDAVAELPGRTRIEATGEVTLEGEGGFAGDLLVASRQPSGFSDWLSGGVDPALRGLGGAGLSARVALGTERQAFEALEVTIGAGTLKGRLERSGGAQPAIDADLSGGALDLDAFLALSKFFTGEGRGLAEGGTVALRLAAGPVTYGGGTAARIDADLKVDPRRIDVRRFDVAGLAGADLKAVGHLDELSGDASGTMKVSLQAEAPQALIAYANERLPDRPILAAMARRADVLGPLTLSGTLATQAGEPGRAPSLLVDLTGTAAGTKIDLSSAVENGFSALARSGRFGLDVRLESDAPAVLLGQLGLEALPLDTLPTPLEFEATLSAAETGPIVTAASLRAPGSELIMDGILEATAAGPAGGEFQAMLQSEDVAPFLLSTLADIGLGPLDAVPADLSAALRWSVAGWTLDGVTGTLGDTRVKASATLPPAGALEGRAELSDLSLPWLARLSFGEAPGEGADGTLWPKTAFPANRLPDRPFEIDLSAQTLALHGGSALTDVRATLRGGGGLVAIEDVSARYLGGTLAGSLALRNAGGIGSAALRARFDSLAPGAIWPALDASGGKASLSGTISLDGSAQSYAGLVSGLTGAGSARLSGAHVPGVAPDAFARALVVADRPDFRLDTDAGAAAIAALADGSGLALDGEKSSAFTVTGGRMSFVPVTEENGPSRLTLSGDIDLAAATVSGSAALAFDAGPEAIEGTAPGIDYAVSGPLSAPVLSADPQPLVAYLSARALEREEARVEALQESLQEKLRLRRENRLYRWRVAETERARAARVAAEEAERARLAAEQAAARKAAADAAARLEAERQAAAERAALAEREAAERARQASERRRAAEAAAAAERLRATAPRISEPSPQSPASPAGPLDFEPPAGTPGSQPPETFPSLPGVENPLEF
ncbi:AsmA-like C-terminal region-containing protein [Aurantimonas sp. Leaf443]|uniref:AsmA-like C-terminal region-containing protein n=1 Tax=Aurantimonas sp. Leaf443 TaxID=1736378 RepID=UPI0006F364A9|nr:AsmA-like C-terminal region-containing protein [Aurantimonas sp. Leaf443]KQT86073.1 hypothetical protein ASG48_05685 [Aurantimonas sp. Leaf443]